MPLRGTMEDETAPCGPFSRERSEGSSADVLGSTAVHPRRGPRKAHPLQHRRLRGRHRRGPAGARSPPHARRHSPGRRPDRPDAISWPVRADGGRYDQQAARGAGRLPAHDRRRHDQDDPGFWQPHDVALRHGRAADARRRNGPRPGRGDGLRPPRQALHARLSTAGRVPPTANGTSLGPSHSGTRLLPAPKARTPTSCKTRARPASATPTCRPPTRAWPRSSAATTRATSSASTRTSPRRRR